MSGKTFIKVSEHPKREELEQVSTQNKGSVLSAKKNAVIPEPTLRKWVNDFRQRRLEVHWRLEQPPSR